MVIDSVFFQTKVFGLYKELNLLPDKYGATQMFNAGPTL